MSTQQSELPSEMNGKTVFVTVGTTRFDKLVTSVMSPMALQWMTSQGYTNLIVQYGTGEEPTSSIIDDSITNNNIPTIHTYRFQPSLEKDMKQADLIISHAGAGTVMEALRLQKRLIVVINTLLMNNHQTELAEAMAERSHLIMVHNPEAMDDNKTWESFQNFIPIPHLGGDPYDFPKLLDRHFFTTQEQRKQDLKTD